MALQFMRRHHWILKWLLGLVVVSFIWLYVPALSGKADVNTPNETLGKVGDLRITAGEFQKAYVRRRQDISRMTRGKIDVAMLRRLGIPDQVFEGLVGEKLTAFEAHRLGLSVDDEAVARSIQSSPQFQRDGHYIGNATLRRLLAQNGLSEEEFLELTRDELLQRRLQELVTAGVTVSTQEAEREYRRRNEQLKTAYVLVDVARFKSEVQVADEEARARFESKKDAYKVPEKRIVSYLLVDPQALESRITVTPPEIQDYYKAHVDDFRQEEEVCAAHILIKVKPTPDAKVGHPDAEAKQEAEALLKQLKAGGDFAGLAKKSSEDEGSKQQGGDLGCFPRGRMVPDFEKAVFSLEPGALSELVKTNFGYHIIRASSRKPESVQSLEQAKERIRQMLVAERAQARAEAQMQTIASQLARKKGLAEAGKDQGLVPHESLPFARGDSPEPLNSQALVARAFELKKGELASDPFAVPQGFAFIELKDTKPPHVPEWNEVKDKVKADLSDEKALEKSKAKAAELRTRAAQMGLEKAATSLGLVRKETPGLVGRGMSMGDLGASVSLDDAAFSLPEKKLSDPVRVAGGYAVVEVLEKKAYDPAAFEAARVSFTSSLEAEKRAKLFQAYMNDVRKRVGVERMPEVYRRLTS